MNSEQFEMFKVKINELNSTHIKVDNIKIDIETRNVIIDFIQTPRGLRFTIPDMVLNVEEQADKCLLKADGMIKREAILDMVSWIFEKKKHDCANIRGMRILLESNLPDDVILMNHNTFLAFRENI